jgi:hypothetical protein
MIKPPPEHILSNKSSIKITIKPAHSGSVYARVCIIIWRGKRKFHEIIFTGERDFVVGVQYCNLSLSAFTPVGGGVG